MCDVINKNHNIFKSRCVLLLSPARTLHKKFATQKLNKGYSYPLADVSLGKYF